MKRLILGLFAAVALAGIASAEPRRGLEGTADWNTYQSTNVIAGSTQAAFGSYLWKIIVSSPAATTGTGGSSVTFYNASGSAVNKVFSINVSTNNLTNATEFGLGVYFSSGMFTTHLTTGVAGSVQAIFKRNGVPDGAKVWQSTFTPVDGSTQTIAAGPVLLHKVLVLDKGAGTQFLEIHNSRSATPENMVAQIDLSAIKADGYTFDMMLSSGLVITGGAGSGAAPNVMILYKRNAPRDWEYWTPRFASGTVTNSIVMTGRGVLGGVVVGNTAATGQLTVMDSNGVDDKPIALIDTVGTTGKIRYDVNVSSGISITNLGSGQSTILYRRIK